MVFYNKIHVKKKLHIVSSSLDLHVFYLVYPKKLHMLYVIALNIDLEVSRIKIERFSYVCSKISFECNPKFMFLLKHVHWTRTIQFCRKKLQVITLKFGEQANMLEN